jgi:hypothetical protein
MLNTGHVVLVVFESRFQRKGSGEEKAIEVY